MDNRICLKAGTCLSFPGMECRVESFVGKGSNAMVYIGTYPDEQWKDLRHRVLIKELFPFHPQGMIFRDSEGNVCCTEEARPLMELHRLSFQRANEIHLQILSEYPADIDANINTFSQNQTLYSVLGFSGGRSLDKEMEQETGTPLAVYVRRMMGALDVLEAFHNFGLLHLDISPDNILLIGEGKRERISLIDYNSVHTLEEIRQGGSFYYSAKEGFAAPEIRSGRSSAIGYGTDLYALTAVFYRMLTGRNLTVLETVRGQVPDISDAPCLADAPETVRSMVRKILKRGLAATVSRRYRAAGQMRQDLEELMDRIEGKGITHPALWETGRANILRAINSNSALRYIKEEEKLYPVVGETKSGERISSEELLSRMLSPGGSSFFLLGEGGAGKTTALLRAAYLQPAKYSGAEPAVTYLSLYGWTEGKSDYIKNRILESLKFKPETDSMELARHELVRLLSVPMYTRFGECPQLLILLDGLNEISGNTKELLQEIMELSAMPGTRILLAGRSDIEAVPFQRIRLKLLEKEEVGKILGENGILQPEAKEMAELLRSPMMLSIYIRTVISRGKQIFIHSQEELLDSYFAAILDKEIRELPPDAKERWQTEAALFFVLPEIAGLMERKGRELSAQDMLPALEKCYRRMGKRMMTGIFPEWIGHIADIRGESKNAEEWYGTMVHEILFRRLGLLVRDETGRYRMSHQLIEEYLAIIHRGFERKFARRERRQRLLLILTCVLCLGGIYHWVYLPLLAPGQEEVKTPYDEALSENVLDAALSSYMACADQYEAFLGLLEVLSAEAADAEADGGDGDGGETDGGTAYDKALQDCRDSLDNDYLPEAARTSGYLENLLASGEVMPWSGKPLEEEACRALYDLPRERAEEYAGYLDILVWARENKQAWEYFGEEYVQALGQCLQADADLNGKYYNLVVEPELTAMEQSDSEEERQNGTRYRKAAAQAVQQGNITKEATADLEIYKEAQKSALRELKKNGLTALFEDRED